MKDIRTILRLTHEQGLSVREVAERLKIGKTSVSTYLLRAREAGLSCWPLPPDYDDDAVLERHQSVPMACAGGYAELTVYSNR